MSSLEPNLSTVNIIELIIILLQISKKYYDQFFMAADIFSIVGRV